MRITHTKLFKSPLYGRERHLFQRQLINAYGVCRNRDNPYIFQAFLLQPSAAYARACGTWAKR